MKTVPKCRSKHYSVGLPGIAIGVMLLMALLAGCTPVQRPVAAQPATEPVALSFAVPEPQGRTLTPYVLEFVDQVKQLSNGSMVVEPAWDPMAGIPGGNERGLVKRVLDGDFDLAVIATRAWDDQNVPSLHVLQAPFLITDDALAEAVATSKVATRLMDSLSAAGAVGLTMWPEDLRHPFSEMPDEPLLAPQDFAGKVMRAGPANITIDLMKALGATAMMEDSGYQGGESGFLNAYNLFGKPTASGNVTFYPKFDLMFANTAAFERLNEEQRTVLRQAAAAAQAKAIAERPKEVASAAAWCADGGAIVLASPEQLAALEKAAQPIYDQIEADPANAELIAAIRDLKAHTTPAPGAAACAPGAAAAPTISATTLVTLPTTDATMARLRLANWVYGTRPTDMYVDGQLALLGSNQHPLAQIPSGFLTGFLYLEPGRHSVAIVPSIKGKVDAMLALDVDLEAGHRYTVGVMGQKEDGHFSPLVIDETAVLAKAGDPATQNMMIYVNNAPGEDNIDFLEDGVGPRHVPLGGIGAAPLKSGHVDHLVVTINGKQVAEMRDIYEVPSGGFIHASVGHGAVHDGDNWSDLNARDMLKQFGDVHVVWNSAAVLSFNTFLAAVEKAGLNDLLTSGTYLIFAPTDAAFAAMPKDQLDALMADPKALADFVRYHIVQGYYPPGSLSGTVIGVAGSTVTNLQGADLKLSGDLMINGIEVPDLPNLEVADGTRILPVTKVLVPTVH